MKLWFNSILFSYRLAFKNIIKHPLRTMAIALSFLALVIALFLSLSMRQFLTTYFLGELEDQYQEIDVMVNVGQTGNSRFFTIRPFNESLERDQYVRDYAAFFTMDVLLKHEDQSIYVKSMSSDIDQLSKVTTVPDTLAELLDDEIVMTQSLAEILNVNIGDTISLSLANDLKTYTIQEILADEGLFQDNTVFLNKAGSLTFFLTALDPALGALPSFALTNLYNELYLNLEDDITLGQVETWMRSLNGYDALSIEETINLQEISDQINRSFSVFMVITFMVIFAILLVLETSLKVYFNDSKKVMGIIHILGGKPSLSYRMVVYEFSLYIAFSLLLGRFLAKGIIQYGLYFVGGRGTFEFTRSSTYVVLGIVVLLFIFVSLKDYHQMKDKSALSYMREEIVNIKDYRKYILLMLSLSTGIYILTYFVASLSGISLYRLIYAVILLVALPRLIYPILIKQKKPTLHRLHLSMLYQTKAFKHYLFVMLISSVSVLLLGLALGHMDRRYQIHREEFKIDYLLTNFVSSYEETLTEVREIEGVQTADSITIFENMVLLDSGDSILQTVTIQPDLIHTYFNYELSLEALSSLDQSYPTIILPNRFKEVYDLNVGDTILIHVHPETPEVEFVIGGFFEKYLSNLAFTNIGYLNPYQDLGIQTIGITKDDLSSDTLFETLIDAYSSRLIYVIDYQSEVELRIGRMERSTNYMSLIIVAIIICFIISMMNHSLLMFEQMKKNYARMIALGLNRHDLIQTLLKSGGIQLLIVFISASIAFTLIACNMTDLILISGEYEKINIMRSPYLLGAVLSMMITGFVQLVYIYRILKLNPAPTLRVYE